METKLTPNNYAQVLRDSQRLMGAKEGTEYVHDMALRQGFSMNGNAIVTGIKWVRGAIQEDGSGVLVQGLHSDPSQTLLFKV